MDLEAKYALNGLFDLLLEGRVDKIKELYPSKSDDIDYLAKMDPSGNNKYLAWQVRQLVRDAEDTIDVEEMAKNVATYHKYVHLFPSKDIYSFKTYEDFMMAVLDVSIESFAFNEPRPHIPDSTMMKDVPGVYYIVRPHAEEPACRYAEDVKWCVADRTKNWFATYNNRGNAFYYVVFNKKLFERPAVKEAEISYSKYGKAAVVVDTGIGRLNRSEGIRHKLNQDMGQPFFAKLWNLLGLGSVQSGNRLIANLIAHAMENKPEYVEGTGHRFNWEEMDRIARETNEKSTSFHVSFDQSAAEYYLFNNHEEDEWVEAYVSGDVTFHYDPLLYKFNWEEIRERSDSGGRGYDVDNESAWLEFIADAIARGEIGTHLSIQYFNDDYITASDYVDDVEIDENAGVIKFPLVSSGTHIASEGDFEFFCDNMLSDEGKATDYFFKDSSDFVKVLLEKGFMIFVGDVSASADGYEFKHITQYVENDNQTQAQIDFDIEFNLPLAGKLTGDGDDLRRHHSNIISAAQVSLKKGIKEYFDGGTFDGVWLVFAKRKTDPQLPLKEDLAPLRSTISNSTEVHVFMPDVESKTQWQGGGYVDLKNDSNTLSAKVTVLLSNQSFTAPLLRGVATAIDATYDKMLNFVIEYVANAMSERYFDAYPREPRKMEENNKLQASELIKLVREELFRGLEEISAAGSGAISGTAGTLELGVAAGESKERNPDEENEVLEETEDDK